MLSHMLRAAAYKPSGANPAYVAVGTFAKANASGFTVTLPSGWSAGQFAIMFICDRSNSGTTPTYSVTGWTQVGSTLVSGTQLYAAVFYRFLQSGDSAPTVTITNHTAGRNVGAFVSTYSNINTTTPLDVTHGTATASSATSINAPSVTTVNDNSMIVRFWCAQGLINMSVNTSGGDTAYVSGTTQQLDGPSSGNCTNAAAYKLQTAAGASGTVSASWSTAGLALAWTIPLRKA